MLAQLADVYRKLRNTSRFLLGNLYDFDPKVDAVPENELSDLDRFVLHRLHKVTAEITQTFDRFEFFKFYQLLQNFCNVDLSSFYFDIVKDVLYTAPAKSHSRRSKQTVLDEVLQVLVRLLVPVTPHLAEDIWQHIPEKIKAAHNNPISVLLTDFPQAQKIQKDAAFIEYWENMLAVRYTVNKALELARGTKKIGSSLEAQVLLEFENRNLQAKVFELGSDLSSFFITSQAVVKDANYKNGKDHGEPLAHLAENGLSVTVLTADGKKCLRCRKFSTGVGEDQAYPDLDLQCANIEKGQDQ
jgi:isoleucyl-tRNA synthetase